jgi:site-specific DNA-methyltransferase (adenine-specific)
LDNACGSGSFLLSAILENRQYIGIEKNEDVLMHKIKPVDYIKICNERIVETRYIKASEQTLFIVSDKKKKYNPDQKKTKPKVKINAKDKL